MKKIFGLLILTGLISCQQNINCPYQIPVDQNDLLSVSTIIDHNFDSIRFNNLNQDICKGKYGNIHSLLIMNDSELIVEQYYGTGDRDELHFLASVTKGIVAILTGIAIDKGYIDSLNQPMLNYFPNYKAVETDERKYEITIEHLLTMTSGFEWDELSLPFTDPNNDGAKMDHSENLIDECLNLEMDTIPGTKYVYCGPNDIILGEIIKISSGKNIAEFAEKNLFKPLQIDEYRWSSTNDIFHAGGGLWMSSRSMLKIGQLLLNEGKIGATPVISKNWIDKMFTPYIEVKKPFYMGYQWRIANSEEGILIYHIPGNGGQLINIVPDLNLVFIITADNRGQKYPLGELIESVLRIHPEYKKKTKHR